MKVIKFLHKTTEHGEIIHVCVGNKKVGRIFPVNGKAGGDYKFDLALQAITNMTFTHPDLGLMQTVVVEVLSYDG